MTHKSLHITPLFTCLVLLSIALSGCASFYAANAQRSYIQNQTSNFVYQQPCENVWPHAHQLLFEKGYAVRHAAEGALTMETDWLEHAQHTTYNYHTRYLIIGTRRGAGTCQIQFTQNRRSNSGSLSSKRDFDLEWELIQRADPQSAATIQSGAYQHGQNTSERQRIRAR